MINKKISGFTPVVYVIVLVYAIYLFGVPVLNPVTAKPSDASSVEKQFENSMLVFPGELVKAEKNFDNSNMSKIPDHENNTASGSFSNANIVVAQLLSQTPSDSIMITANPALSENEIETEMANDNGADSIQELKLSSLINIGRDSENIFGRETDRGQIFNPNNKLSFNSLQKNFYGAAAAIRDNEISSSKLYLSIDEKNEGVPAENLNYAMLTVNDNMSAAESDTAIDMADIDQNQNTLPTNNILQNITLTDINIAALTGENNGASKAAENREFNKVHIVTQTDTLFSIAKSYNVSVSEIMSANQLHSVDVKAGLSLSVPSIDKKKLEISKIASSKESAVSQTAPDRRFLWPSSSRLITSKYGTRIHPVYHSRKFHNGLDIGASYGSKIRAAENGTVVFSDWKSGYGRTVIIKHSKDLYTLYAHCSVLTAKRGQSVKRGDTIAKIGSSGISTGPHLHFSVQKNGSFINPMIKL